MHVLISGAGIAGSTLAWHLARLDVKITVLERSKAYLGQGQNIDLSGGAIKIMKRMKLIEEVRKYNTGEKGTAFLNQAGKEIATFPVSSTAPSPTSEFEILRGDLALVLYNAVKDHPNVNYLFETSIEELISNTDTSVKVKLSNGETHEYDIAFAADGQWSKLRKLAFPSDSIKVVDRNAYCAYWTVPRQADDTDWWHVHWGLKSRVCSLRPDSHGTMRAFLSKMPLDKEEKDSWEQVVRQDKKVQQEVVKRHFAGAGWKTQRFLDALDTSPDFYLQGLQQIKMQKWWTGRVVCLGDAAHAPTSITGAGTTLAIIGAYVLAGEISKLQSNESPQTAFKAFDDKFHKHTDNVQDMPSFVPGIAHPASKWHLWALQTGFSTIATALRLPFVGRALGSRDEESNDDGFPLPEYPILDAKINAAV